MYTPVSKVKDFCATVSYTANQISPLPFRPGSMAALAEPAAASSAAATSALSLKFISSAPNLINQKVVMLSAPLWGRPGGLRVRPTGNGARMAADRATLESTDDTRWGNRGPKIEPVGSCANRPANGLVIACRRANHGHAAVPAQWPWRLPGRVCGRPVSSWRGAGGF